MKLKSITGNFVSFRSKELTNSDKSGLFHGWNGPQFQSDLYSKCKFELTEVKLICLFILVFKYSDFFNSDTLCNGIFQYEIPVFFPSTASWFAITCGVRDSGGERFYGPDFTRASNQGQFEHHGPARFEGDRGLDRPLRIGRESSLYQTGICEYEHGGTRG